MELNERKQKILEAIIRNYMETGEPVGSRTVSKYTDLNLSSATIRNEMSDLEEMGYILQPHTSAGRIPSDKAYRLYVDTILQRKDEEVSEMKELMVEKADKIDLLLQQVAKLLAQNTNYTSMVTKPKYQHKRIKFIQLNQMSERQLLDQIQVLLAGRAAELLLSGEDGATSGAANDLARAAELCAAMVMDLGMGGDHHDALRR